MAPEGNIEDRRHGDEGRGVSKGPRPDVAIYHRVACRFWPDEAVRTWPDQYKLAALYFLTSPHRTLEGIYRMHPSYAAVDLGWTVKKVRGAIAFLEKAGFLRFDSVANVVWIRNSLRYQTPESENVVKGAIRRILDLPDTPLLKEFLDLARTHCAREGAPKLARTFVEELERAFERPSGRASELLTSTSTCTSTSTSPRPVPRLAGAADETFVSSAGGSEEAKPAKPEDQRKPDDGLEGAGAILQRLSPELRGIFEGNVT